MFHNHRQNRKGMKGLMMEWTRRLGNHTGKHWIRVEEDLQINYFEVIVHFSNSCTRVVRFATVFEFLTGDEICLTVSLKKLKSKKSRILNQI